MTVTPEMAVQWLDTNTQNRSIREHVVTKLAGAIHRDEWRVNGDAIRFDEAGALIDGQHRLMAVVQANKPMQTFVATGIPRVSQITMDTGAKRSLADALRMQGEVSCINLAATLRLYWRYEKGTLRWNRNEPTYEELLTLLEDCPDIRQSVQVGSVTATPPVRTSRTVAAVAHFLFAQIDAEEADYFFQRVRDGVDLDENDPIRRLREWIINAASSGVKVTQVYVLALYIKAWNAYIEGRPLGALRWRIGGKQPEAFPIPSAADAA